MISIAKENDSNEKVQDLLDQVEAQQHSIFGTEEKCVYLRSSIMHGSLPSLSSKLNKKIEAVMKELMVPDKPMPTKAVHGLYDSLRRNILRLYSLQISLKNKEEEKKRLQEKVEKEKQREGESMLVKRAPEPMMSDPKSNKKMVKKN
jgi:hypothetical protein